jgi:hypothetical protein
MLNSQGMGGWFRTSLVPSLAISPKRGQEGFGSAAGRCRFRGAVGYKGYRFFRTRTRVLPHAHARRPEFKTARIGHHHAQWRRQTFQRFEFVGHRSFGHEFAAIRLGIDQGAQLRQVACGAIAPSFIQPIEQAHQQPGITGPTADDFGHARPLNHLLLPLQRPLDGNMLDLAHSLGQRQIPSHPKTGSIGMAAQAIGHHAAHADPAAGHGHAAGIRQHLQEILLPRRRPAIVADRFGGGIGWGGEMVAHGRECNPALGL